MKVSVLIPAYQAGAFIGAALQSVRAQTHADWEIVVVEDGSRDETADVVARFGGEGPQAVRYDNLGANQGVGAVRNRLIALAQGDALAFLDADDTWTPEHLAKGVARLEQGADLVVSDVRTFDLVSGRPLEMISPPAQLEEDPVLTLFQRSVIVTSSAVLLTKALAEKTGRFDEALRIGEDRDFWLRCALAGGRFGRTHALTCRYAKHNSSTMARTYAVAQHVTRFYEKHRSLKRVPEALRRRLLADSLLCEGRLLREHNHRHSVQCFWRAWRCEPFDARILLHLAFTGWRSLTAGRTA